MKSLMLSAVLLALAAGCNGNSSDTKHTDMNGGSSTAMPSDPPTTQAAACPTTRPSNQAVQASAQAKPINKLCPIEHDAIDPTVTYVYNGKVIGFCCADCIPKFKKDPEKYMKDLK